MDITSKTRVLPKKPRQTVGIAAVLALLAGPVLSNPWAPQAEAGGPLPPVPPTQKITYGDLLSAQDRLLNALPETGHDPAALAQSLGTDPDSAFAFVRDRIRTEPYAGTLRSPAGVLAGGAGNVQDKAELLATLFEMMGFDARIASGPLNPGSAVIHGCQALPLPPLPGLVPPMLERIAARAARDHASLRAALPEATPKPPELAGDRVHYWVQMRRPGGAWLDYDPAFPDAEAGQAFATMAGLSRGGIDPHEVEIRVQVEVLRSGRLSESTLLSHKMAARDAAEVPISLGFAPEAPGLGGLVADALASILSARPRLRPILIVDGAITRGAVFDMPGLAQGDNGVFSGEQDQVVTAVYLDLARVSPGGSKHTVRRAVIDLLDWPTRAAGSPTPDAVGTAETGARFLAALESVRHIAVSNGGLSARLAALRQAAIVAELDSLLTQMRDGTLDPEMAMWIAWSQLQAMAVASEQIARQMVTDDGESCAAIGEARIYLSGAGVTGTGRFSQYFDWTMDGIAVSGTPDAATAFDIRLWYGAVQSALENGLLETWPSGEDVTRQSTSTLTEGALALVSAADVAGGTVRSAQEDAAQGFQLLSAAANTPAAWWRVDPDTGATDARMGNIGNSVETSAGTFGSVETGVVFADPVDYVSFRPDPRMSMPEQERAFEKWLEYRRKLRRLERKAPKKGGGNEYLTILLMVSIPTSVYAGGTIGTSVNQGVATALYGPPA